MEINANAPSVENPCTLTPSPTGVTQVKYGVSSPNGVGNLTSSTIGNISCRTA